MLSSNMSEPLPVKCCFKIGVERLSNAGHALIRSAGVHRCAVLRLFATDTGRPVKSKQGNAVNDVHLRIGSPDIAALNGS